MLLPSRRRVVVGVVAAWIIVLVPMQAEVARGATSAPTECRPTSTRRPLGLALGNRASTSVSFPLAEPAATRCFLIVRADLSFDAATQQTRDTASVFTLTADGQPGLHVAILQRHGTQDLSISSYSNSGDRGTAVLWTHGSFVARSYLVTPVRAGERTIQLELNLDGPAQARPAITVHTVGIDYTPLTWDAVHLGSTQRELNFTVVAGKLSTVRIKFVSVSPVVHSVDVRLSLHPHSGTNSLPSMLTSRVQFDKSGHGAAVFKIRPRDHGSYFCVLTTSQYNPISVPVGIVVATRQNGLNASGRVIFVLVGLSCLYLGLRTFPPRRSRSKSA